MIDDAFALARAGLLDYDIALDLSLYMVNEEDYIPWQTLVDNWKYIEHRLENLPIYTNFRNVQLKLIKKQVIFFSFKNFDVEKCLGVYCSMKWCCLPVCFWGIMGLCCTLQSYVHLQL
jgi:aminopeptidase N